VARRRRLLLDMDGVITRFFKRIFDLYFEQYGVRYHEEDLKRHALEDLVGSEVYEKMAAIFNAPGFFASIEPYEGAIDEVNALNEMCDVWITTAPTTWKDPKTGRRGVNPHCMVEKMAWISDRLPTLTRRVIITKDKSIIRGDALADDSDHNFGPWAEANPTGLAAVIDQPWNRSAAMPKNAVRTTLHELGGVLQLAWGE
jgi:5'(3')-deoxyribonucleotidase